ncbi:unnamed protein product [Clavelina lepadiformis]|uniref:Uncharacterized protein n=1 Tax=Clavelina lepadiformis TaxID=159417 RepID=A0ABP0FKT1_CLALP
MDPENYCNDNDDHKASLPGLEPGTSGLEVQRANPLRHRDGERRRPQSVPCSLPLEAKFSIITKDNVFKERSFLESVIEIKLFKPCSR